MKLRLLILIVLLNLVATQDVAVPDSIEPTTTTTTTTEKIEILPPDNPVETTESSHAEEEATTEANNDDSQANWIENPNGNDLISDNYIDASHPYYVYPQIPQYYPQYPSYNDPNCNFNQIPQQLPPPPPIHIPSQPPVPPIYNPVTDKPEVEEITQCPIGSIQQGSKCIPIALNSCPNGYIWKDDRCVLSQTSCPLNFDYDGTSCVERQICPPNHVMKDGICVQPEPQCPDNYRWNGYRCEILYIQCQPGFVLRNNECVFETVTCPSGSEMINGQCVTPEPQCPPDHEMLASGFCSKLNIRCPPGSVLVNGQCQKNRISCPPGTQLIGDQCYQTFVPPPATTRRPTIKPPIKDDTTTEFPQIEPPIYIQPPPSYRVCPTGFIFFNGQCYRCPYGYTFCNGICSRNVAPCNQYIPPPPIYPPPPSYPHIQQPNINININFTRPALSNVPAYSGKPYNIVNNIEPINNTIHNFNNVTHPVTLNNVNENNIYIYTETQCADGTIRATVVKNNETITSCVEPQSTSRPPPKKDVENEIEVDEKPEKCCEIITPRQCKKRFTDQWICTHRRYRYCGKFCIADRLYMRPQTTSWVNQVLTVAPAPSNMGWVKPCFGRDCPPVDCSGCTDGSYNCSPQCYTYPCSSEACTYVDQDDFCENVEGQMCE